MKIVPFHRPDGKKHSIEIIKYLTGDDARDKLYERHRHDFHTILFIQQGHSQQEIDFEQFVIEQDQIVIIPKGAVHWEKQVKDLVGYVILFKDDFFSDLQRELLNSFLQYAVAARKLCIPIEQQQLQSLNYYFELLWQEQADEVNQNQTFLLQNLMLALLNKLEGLIQGLPELNSFITTRRPFQRFIDLVERNYTKQEPLDFYTTTLGITNRKLNEITKQVTGLTASNFIIEKIIIAAKRELCFSEKSIKEISNELGYESQYYFSRIFKKRTNLSPEQFRAQFAE